MTHYIKLKDDNVLFMDDTTGDIVVDKENLPSRTVTDDTVFVNFVEDPETISHKYTVLGDSTDGCCVILSWEGQIGESLKTSLQERRIKLDTPEGVEKYALTTLILRDIRRGSKWLYYIPHGKKYPSAPQTWEEVKPLYDEVRKNKKLTPEVANAIVATKNHMYVRVAMMDVLKSKRYFDGDNPTKILSEVDEKYFLKMPNSSETEDAPQEDTTDPKKDQTNKPEDKESSHYNLGVSKTSYAQFLRLINTMKPKMYDGMDKLVTKEFINIPYNQLPDYMIEVDGKKVPVINFIKKAVKNKALIEAMLQEADVRLSPEDIWNPSEINLKQKAEKALEQERIEAEEQARKAKAEEIKQTYLPVIDELHKTWSGSASVEDTLEVLFKGLVPPTGAAETVAGEYVRAIMRIIYRDYNDGDKFFEGYGLETCGSSAEYLYDHGFAKEIASIIDRAHLLADDDDKYTEAIWKLAEKVIETIITDETLVWQVNEEDSRDYPVDYVEENQPRYEFELYGSDDVDLLIENGIITAWDLNSYVEQQLSYESRYFEDAEVSRPWSSNSTTVTVENLTKDGYDWLEDAFNKNPEGYWEDLVSEYTSDLEEIKNGFEDDDDDDSDDEE